MLESLHIENIAIIRLLDIDFSTGFHVLTGETGAGKSIMIDSISLLLGGKADKEWIRHGASSLSVSGTFSQLSEKQHLRLIELGILPEDADKDEPILLSRTVTADGRSTIRCCGRPITLSLLKEIGSSLLSIYGQHESERLLHKPTHLSILDAYAGTEPERTAYEEAYYIWKESEKELASLSKGETEKNRMREILRYQISDIDSAKLKPGEEKSLLSLRDRLLFAEKISKNTTFVYHALKGAEKGNALLLLEKSETALSMLTSVLPETSDLALRIRNCRYELDDIAETVLELAEDDGEGNVTERLNRVEARLDLIGKLKKKYGETVEEILSFRENANKELSLLEHAEDKILEIEDRIQKEALQVRKRGELLSKRRREAARTLEKEVAAVLSYLDMPKVRFETRIDPLMSLQKDGLDDIEFLISANPGVPPAPLIKIASGGELSRIMLALRSVLSEKDGLHTQIFDEVDTGVSGKTAQKVGIKLKETAKNGQVICITHSAQIAALADTHFRIQKNEIDGKNETSLSELDLDGRITEIARILGGIRVSDVQLRAAAELIEEGKNMSSQC